MPKKALKISNFHHFTSRNAKRAGHKKVNMTVYFEANFSKTTERNKTPFTWIKVQLKLSSNQKTDPKLVNSTTRYYQK